MFYGFLYALILPSLQSIRTEQIHIMSQHSEFLDDSDLEDEAFLLELEQQVTSKSGTYSPSNSLQQRQLTTIL